MEVGDAADHRRSGDEVIAVRDQLGHEAEVAAVALDEAIPRVRVVGPGDRSVLREVVDPDDLVAALQELLYEIAADEAGGTAHDDRAHLILGPNA